MAKEIKFNIKLMVDGKEQLVTASTSAAELQANLEASKDKATRLRDTLITFNQSVEAIRSITGAVTQLAGTLNSVTEESRTFSAAMNAANTMAGKSGDDFAKLKGSVAELAETIPVAREELANGLYQVISNGVPEDNWIEYLQKSAKASVGGIADLGETVKVTSTIIKNYGLAWDQAGDVQDKIQLTAKNGVTSFEQLAQALPRVTSNAATLGVSIDELMATFATLTGVSGNTAEVSTQLAAIFTALVKPSSEATKMAQQMGIEFDAAAIKAAGGMRNFLTELDKDVKAYASKSGMLEQEIYGKLFGSAESLRALGPLTGQLAAKFNENVDAMKGSAGTIDDAFATMSSSGAASLQMLKNKIGEFTDGIASAMGGIMPYLNISSQVGNSVVAVLALNKALQTFNVTQGIVKTRILATNAASVVWNATSVRMNALTQVMSASFRGASVSAATLKLAIQGLLISTGVGVAIVALTEIISAFTSKSEDAETQAEDTAKSMKGMGDAADEVKSAYDSALKNTYADLIAKYEQLKAGWRALSTEQKKMAWIKDNQSAFDELRLKIGNVSEAENIFNRKTDAVVEAFKQRALAAAYAAKLTALYQKQIGLLDKKQQITKDIANDAKQGGRNAKEGDVVPESWRNERYGRVGNDGQWRFTKEGAERYNGTNVSGNAQINSIDKQINAVDRQIDNTQKQLTEQLKTAKNFVTADKPTVSTTDTQKKTTVGGDKNDDPKTYVEKLQAQLTAAKKDLENATTIEAKVEADAKVKDIQAQIDEATKGKVSIEAETEPTYITKGSDADKRQSHANAQSRIDRIKQDYEIGIVGKDEAEKQIADLNKQLLELGLKPIEVHFKTHVEELQEQLREAQQEFDEASTIDAKVKADAKISDIQRQIDEATKGKLTIEAETEPTYITKGSTADKRQSYANAQSKASRIQTDFEIGLIGKDEAEKQIADLNKQIAGMGDNLKPLKLEVDTSQAVDGLASLKQGWSSISGIANGFQQMTDAIEGNGNAWQTISGFISGFISVAEGIQAISGIINALTTATTLSTAATAAKTVATTADATADTAAIGTQTGVIAATVGVIAANKLATASYLELASAEFFAAHAYIPFAGAGIAMGFIATAIAMTKAIGLMAFATGGVVGGTQTHGDKKFVRVNSGEMILNKFQQTQLFNMINGAYQPPVMYERQLPRVTADNMMPRDTEVSQTLVNVNVKGSIRKMMEIEKKEERLAKKSGRKWS